MTREEIDESLGQCQLEAVILLDRINHYRAERRPAKYRAQIEEYTARIAELELDTARLLDMELANDTAEVTDGAVRTTAAMKRAMRRARAEGTTPVAGAERVGRAMNRGGATLIMATGHRTWELRDEEGGTYRLTLAPGRTTGLMRWIKRSAL